MTTGAGLFTSLVSAHDAPPLPQTKRNATAIFDKDAVCIEFLPSSIHDLMLSSCNIFYSVTASTDASQMACFRERTARDCAVQRVDWRHPQSRPDFGPGRPHHAPRK